GRFQPVAKRGHGPARIGVAQPPREVFECRCHLGLPARLLSGIAPGATARLRLSLNIREQACQKGGMDSPSPPAYTSQTLIKGLRLLEALVRDGGRSTLSAVAAQLALPPQTAHRLALTL